MNTLTEEFNSVYADVDDDIAEKEDKPKALVVATAYQPLVVKPLRGYESIMRKHAAACEAGR
jgi:hypothetical protein